MCSLWWCSRSECHAGEGSSASGAGTGVSVHIIHGVVVAKCVPTASPCYFPIDERWGEFVPASFLMPLLLQGCSAQREEKG